MSSDRDYRQALYAAAMAYVGQGVAVIPMHPVAYSAAGKKSIRPMIQWEQHPEQLVTTAEQVERWFGGFSGAQALAIATGPSGLVMIDGDAYKEGADQRDPPAGAWVEYRTPDSWHAYMLNPTGARNSAGAVAAGIDVRGVSGLSIAAPTRCTHADGSITQWQNPGLVALNRGDLADVPLELITSKRRPRLAEAGTATEMTPSHATAIVTQWRDLWLSCVQGSRHATMLEYLGALARFEMASGTPVSDMYATLEAAVNEHPDAVAGEEFESAPSAIEYAVGKAIEAPWVIVERRSGFEGRFDAPAAPPPLPVGSRATLPTLGAEFWEARPVLAHIRLAAWAKRTTPDAVVHAVLARLAAGRRAAIRIDSGIDDSTLNYFAALIGRSGGGKSRAWDLAARLLPLDLDECPVLELGSGEGVATAYMGTVKVLDPETMKTTPKREQVRHNVMFHVDEGAALTAMLARSGSTLGPTLRSAYSGAVLGQQNATEERTRRVSGYSTGLVIGFQPDTIQALIQDSHAGTPQRFAYAAAESADIPDKRPERPGDLPGTFAGVLFGGTANPYDGPGTPEFGTMLVVPQRVTDEIDAALLKAARGDVPPELDSQRIASLLRFAGLLALLEGRFAVTDEDWQLAEVMWTASAAVRDALVARFSESAERARDVADGYFADRQVRAATAVSAAPRAVARVAARLAQQVHAEGALTRGAANRMLASRDRKLLEAALEHGQAEGWFVLNADADLKPGSNRPAQ